MIVDYDPRWAAQFRATADEIRRVAGNSWVIEHIGSTAIPGLAAKPIIDLAVRVERPSDVDGYEDDLAAIGFVRHHNGPRTHAVFVRSTDSRRTHIAHFFTADQWDACNQRIFRDWLLTHPDDRIRYQQAKTSAAAIAHGGRDYTARKTAVIQDIVNRARLARGLAPVDVWEK